MNASPCSGLQEGLVVLCARQDPVQERLFFAQLADTAAEDCTLRLNQTGFHSTSIVFNNDGVVVEVRVAFNVVGGTKVLKLLVWKTRCDLLQELDDILLFVQQLLIS